jgi:hypothetical protein
MFVSHQSMMMLQVREEYVHTLARENAQATARGARTKQIGILLDIIHIMQMNRLTHLCLFCASTV